MTAVSIVGGGVIGLATAWRSTQHGLDVTVIDPAPGSGASHAAAGMLCPVTEVHYGEQPLLSLALESARRWPAFAAELVEASGVDVGHRRDGTLAVAFDDDDMAVLDELVRFQRSLGLEVERLRSRECRALEPHLSPRARGGALVAGDHQVDNRKLVRALLTACKRSGVQFDPRSATSLAAGQVVVEGGDVVEADRIVLAAGCWSSALYDLPVRPVKGQILRLRTDPAEILVRRNIRGWSRGRSVYVVPRSDGEVVVGATVEEQGFDVRVTAGSVHDLLHAATDLVPGLAELELAESHAGLRPGTPDNAPIIGPAPEPWLVLATGHYRNGILLAPVTADSVADVLTGRPTPPAIAPFGLARFAS